MTKKKLLLLLGIVFHSILYVSCRKNAEHNLIYWSRAVSLKKCGYALGYNLSSEDIETAKVQVMMIEGAEGFKPTYKCDEVSLMKQKIEFDLKQVFACRCNIEINKIRSKENTTIKDFQNIMDTITTEELMIRSQIADDIRNQKSSEKMTYQKYQIYVDQLLRKLGQ